MAVALQEYKRIIEELNTQHIRLVAVSKIKPVSDILELYNAGHLDFGENYVQELLEKQKALPANIRWHFIGHLQTNKVKQIVPFVHLIHGVDSLKLLKEINKEAGKNGRIVQVLLQMHIAQEETKFGLDEMELNEILAQLDPLDHILIKGLMGMASFTEDISVVEKEFSHLKSVYDKLSAIQHPVLQIDTLSMGMSNDYPLAIKNGSNMVRIGSLLFGRR